MVDRPRLGPPHHHGSASLVDRLRNRYLSRLVARSAIDPVVGAAFRDVSAVTAPISLPANPAVVLPTALLPRRPGLPHPPPDIEDAPGASKSG
ncbi:hypothetical protein [Streptomyces sp. NBC_01451]|uniref:hypothetical protein n=1 Tax=Streptomyces sp. NBC_01451 TaxID=2903872 RepID=UPI002E309CA1|nr:hypothetical protein [Streptomyces sp. NBC_01451]